MIRSGRMRSALRTRSRIVTSPSPSMFGGRRLQAQRRGAGCSCSSAASSIVTMRSSSGMSRRQRVQQRRLAGAGAAGDQDVEPRLDHRGRGTRPVSGVSVPRRDEVARADSGSAANLRIVSSGPVERQRRDDRVDAAAVGQAGVDHRRGLVDAPADLGDDLVDDAPQVRLVAEAASRLVTSRPSRSTQMSYGPLTMISVTVSSARSCSIGPCAERVVGDLVDEPLAVGHRRARAPRRGGRGPRRGRARAARRGSIVGGRSCGPSSAMTAAWTRSRSSANASSGGRREPGGRRRCARGAPCSALPRSRRVRPAAARGSRPAAHSSASARKALAGSERRLPGRSARLVDRPHDVAVARHQHVGRPPEQRHVVGVA